MTFAHGAGPTVTIDHACVRCSYPLRDLPTDGNCPECGMSIAESLRGDPMSSAKVTGDRYCVRCSYNLRGIATAGKCPECGTPVSESLKGDLLRHAAPEYVGTVRSGISLVLNGIILYIVLTIGVFLAAAWRGLLGGVPVNAIAAVVGIPVYLMILLGYWRYTEPDPASLFTEHSKAARKVVRVMVAIQAGLQVVATLLELLDIISPGLSQAPAILLASGLAALGGLVLWAVQFFATMRYTRLLARCVPDRHIMGRTRVYTWLLPIFMTVGVLALGLGLLIAVIMYWNLLDRLRKHLKAIGETGEPARLKGA